MIIDYLRPVTFLKQFYFLGLLSNSIRSDLILGTLYDIPASRPRYVGLTLKRSSVAQTGGLTMRNLSRAKIQEDPSDHLSLMNQ